MTAIIAIFTTLVVLLGTGGAALGQAREAIDILTNVLGLNRTVRGHVVQQQDGMLVVRGDDRRTYAISTTALGASAAGRLTEGEPVTVTLRREPEGGTPVAESVEQAAGGRASFQRIEGTVESVSGDRVTFRTRDGRTVTLDRSRIVGPMPRLSTGESASLIYEGDPQTAVWIDARTAAASTAPLPGASGAPAGAYQRVHGYVQSVGLGTLTMKTDDGRTLTVDTSQVAARTGVRPGDLVSVVGKPAADGGDRFVAEVIHPDGGGAASPR
jgi:hypothetical protein